MGCYLISSRLNKAKRLYNEWNVVHYDGSKIRLDGIKLSKHKVWVNVTLYEMGANCAR